MALNEMQQNHATKNIPVHGKDFWSYWRKHGVLGTVSVTV